MTTDQTNTKPYGNGITEPIHPIDPAAEWLAWRLEPGNFPHFALTGDVREVSPEEITRIVRERDEFLRQMIQPDVREVLRELADARAQLAELKVEWSPRASEASFNTKQRALDAAAKRYGNGPVDDDEVVWRLVGGWHDGTEDPAGEKP